MRPATRTTITAAAGFVVSAALAFVVGRGVHTPAVPPPEMPGLEASEPVVVPVIVNPDDDLATLAIEASDQEIASRGIASELGVPLTGSGAEARGISPGDGADSPSDEPPGFGSDPARWPPPSGSPPADEVVSDACAGGGEGCPDGVGGTILLALRALPPLAGEAAPNPPATAVWRWTPTCPPMEVPGNSAYFGFVTNRPVVIRFRYEGGPWFRGAHYAEGERTFVTPDGLEGPWNDWVADEAAAEDDPRSLIKQCILIEDLPAHSNYRAYIEYEDKYDPSTVVWNSPYPYQFSVADRRGLIPGEQRRPTFLLPYGIDDLRVGVTRRPEQRVEAVALPDGQPGDCNTGGDEADIIYADDVIRGRVIADTAIPRSQLDDPGYPYLPEHSMSTVLRLSLVEGTDYRLCIYWLGEGTSFDAGEVQIAEETAVSTPEAYRPRFRLHGLTELFGEIDRGAVSIPRCGGGGVDLGAFAAGDAVMLTEPLVLCTAEEGLTELDRGIPVRSEARGATDSRLYTGGTFIRTHLECDDSPCRIRFPEMALIPLPAVPTERRLCGSGFGDGCAGEIPMRSAGFAVVEVEFVDVPGNGRLTWSIGEAREFEDTPPPPEGATPLLDVGVTYSFVSHPVNGARAHVTVRADRPVTLGASLLDAMECGLPEPGSFSTPELSQEHAFDFDPLCLGGRYTLDVVARDEAGEQGTIVARYGEEIGSTLGIRVPPAWGVLDISVTVPPPDNDHWHTVYARPVSLVLSAMNPPDGATLGWAWVQEDRQVAARAGWQMFGVNGQANACGQPEATSLTVNAGRRMAPLSQTEITIRAVVDVFENHPASAVYSECAVDRLAVSHVMQATVTIADLFAGVTITSEDGAVFTIRATSYWRELVGGV